MQDETAVKIPEPETTGVERVQRPPSPEETKAMVVVRVKEGIGPFPVSDTIKELQEAGVRGMAGMSLLGALVNRLEDDIRGLREELQKVRDSAESWRRKCHEAELENTSLRSESRFRHLQNGLLVVGGLVAGVAAPYIVQGHAPIAIATTLLGVILILGGWWPLGDREAKTRR